MFLYAFVLNFVISVSIGLAFIQFLFFLFTSKINDSLADFNKHLFLFVSDTLKFLLFETDKSRFLLKNLAKTLQVIQMKLLMLKLMWLRKK
jgi:hypothetical protein